MDEDKLNAFIKKNIAENERIARENNAKRKMERAQKTLSQSGLGKRFQERTFKNFVPNSENKQALQIAKRFAKEFPDTKGIMLVGPVGTGKTHLAAAIMNQLTYDMHDVMFGTMADIISRMKQTFGGYAHETELDILNALTGADLLIIDDMGKEKASDYASTVIYQIVNRLYEDEKPLIITTNCFPQDFETNMGERGKAIMSRLSEMCETVIMGGADWRRKEGRQDGTYHD